MSVRRIRWLLRSAAIMLLVLSVAIVVWAFQSPQLVRVPGSEFAPAGRASAARAKIIRSPPLNDFAKVWRKELRQPLYDPPPTTRQPNRKKNRGPSKGRKSDSQLAVGGVQLMGTMLEDGRSKAIFMNSNGEVDVKGDGETLELVAGVRVDRIELERVTVSNQGRLTTLQLPQTKAP